MTLLPAYGRDYKSKAAALKDFEADRDFIVADLLSPWDGKPANRSALLSMGVREVRIRYRGATAVCVARVGVSA